MDVRNKVIFALVSRDIKLALELLNEDFNYSYSYINLLVFETFIEAICDTMDFEDHSKKFFLDYIWINYGQGWSYHFKKTIQKKGILPVLSEKVYNFFEEIVNNLMQE